MFCNLRSSQVAHQRFSFQYENTDGYSPRVHRQRAKTLLREQIQEELARILTTVNKTCYLRTVVPPTEMGLAIKVNEYTEISTNMRVQKIRSAVLKLNCSSKTCFPQQHIINIETHTLLNRTSIKQVYKSVISQTLL